MKSTRETTPQAVELDDVHRTYWMGEQPVHAIAGVSLSLDHGSYTAVMGPSGSGKSTMMNLIGCLDTPTEGEIYLNGSDVTAMTDRERTALRGKEIGFVFQTFNLMPKLTAVENVELPLQFQTVSRAERRARATELLEQVGLADRAEHRPNELSGGQRQRIAIARALVNEPTLILADEPTGNIDTKTGARIMELFADLNAEGNTILMVTHEPHIAKHADRIVHLLDGTIERTEEVNDPQRTHSAE